MSLFGGLGKIRLYFLLSCEVYCSDTDGNYGLDTYVIVGKPNFVKIQYLILEMKATGPHMAPIIQFISCTSCQGHAVLKTAIHKVVIYHLTLPNIL